MTKLVRDLMHRGLHHLPPERGPGPGGCPAVPNIMSTPLSSPTVTTAPWAFFLIMICWPANGSPRITKAWRPCAS